VDAAVADSAPPRDAFAAPATDAAQPPRPAPPDVAPSTMNGEDAEPGPGSARAGAYEGCACALGRRPGGGGRAPAWLAVVAALVLALARRRGPR
jgi:hypothetical protein